MRTRQSTEFREQADSYRQTARTLDFAPDIRDRYLGWAIDLEQRAVILEEDAERAAKAKKEEKSDAVHR